MSGRNTRRAEIVRAWCNFFVSQAWGGIQPYFSITYRTLKNNDTGVKNCTAIADKSIVLSAYFATPERKDADLLIWALNIEDTEPLAYWRDDAAIAVPLSRLAETIELFEVEVTFNRGSGSALQKQKTMVYGFAIREQ